MNTFKEFYVEVWKHSNGEKMLALHACFTRRDEERKPGINNIWFVMDEKAFNSFCTSTVGALQDGYHRLDWWGDCATFYDFEIPRETRGIAKIPFVRVDFPMFARRLIRRIVNQVWNSHIEPDHRVEVRFNEEQTTRWVKLYGEGRGAVTTMIDDDSKKFLEEKLAEDTSGHLQQQVERLEQMARNSTRAYFETATVRISKDWDGFFWRVRSPKGHEVMHGGLVNHGGKTSDEPPSWSTHT